MVPSAVAPASRQPPTPEELNELLADKVEVLEFIGRGGMGVVYKCRQKVLNRLVALKLLCVREDREEQLIERFTHEACLLAELDHPNIIRIHEFGLIQNSPYFLMDFVEGRNLRQVLNQGKMPIPQVIQMALQICDALEHAHQKGFVHRDIKPENILMDADGPAKLADFGLAFRGEEDSQRLTVTGQCMGTPHYMSPEQHSNPKTVDFRSDIYALGVVLYECVTGELPCGRFGNPSKFHPGLDPRFDDLILQALNSHPDGRQQSVGELRVKLAALQEGQPAGQPPVLSPDQMGILQIKLDRGRSRFLNNPMDVEALQEMKDALVRLGKVEAVIQISYGMAHLYRKTKRLAKASLELEELLKMLSPENPCNERLISRVQDDLAALNLFRPDLMMRRWPEQYAPSPANRQGTYLPPRDFAWLPGEPAAETHQTTLSLI
jgi:serine/threonine protein kinase